MSSITKSKINEFVNVAVMSSEDNEKIEKTVQIIEKGMIPLTHEQIKNLRENAESASVREAARKTLEHRFDTVEKVLEIAAEKDMSLEEMAQWLDCEDTSNVQSIMDRAVEYATLDKTMRLDPAYVKIA